VLLLERRPLARNTFDQVCETCGFFVGLYGGGTGLATQRESLEILGCYGKGGVYKLAEIIAATVLAGELSLGSAVVA
jgi:hydroxymethylglutaryl-CoA reductase